MTRVAVVAGLALVVGGVALTPTGQAFQVQVRDAAPPQNRPTERLIPIGNATINGTVVTGDTGRPIRGANVNINATIGTLPTGGPLIGNPIGTLGRGRAAVASASFAVVSRQAVTDATGRFSIEHLPAGAYVINVNRQQFLLGTYGQRKPGGQGTPVTVAEGQTVSITIPMVRGGSIAGTVYNEDGDPQTQTQVSAWRVVMNNGVKRVQQQNSGTTDDRGQYRIFGLQPGDYFVSATPFANIERLAQDRVQEETDAINRAIASGAVRPPAGPGMPSMVAIPLQTQQLFGAQGQPPGYLPTFAPSVDVPSRATAVHVSGGDEHANVDIQLHLVEASQIVGTVTTPLDEGVGVQINLVPEESSFDVGSLPMARVDPDGKFVLRNVSPGKYVVFAQTVVQPQRGAVPFVARGAVLPPSQPPQLTPSQHLWAQAPVEVAGQSTIDVSLSLKPGKSISGLILFDYKTMAPPDLSQARLNVMLTPAPSPQIIQFGPLPTATVGVDGRFTLTGVIAGHYGIRGNFGVMKSSMVNGQDTLDFPLNFTAESDVSGVVITMTDVQSLVSGHLTDSAGKPALDYTIVLASTDERFWTPASRRILTARTDATGAFTFRYMPPGTYLLGAVTDLEPGGQFDPELLHSLRAASRTVTVAEGDKLVQDLRVK